jgi:hypothetical protein
LGARHCVGKDTVQQVWKARKLLMLPGPIGMVSIREGNIKRDRCRHQGHLPIRVQMRIVHRTRVRDLTLCGDPPCAEGIEHPQRHE